jgi:hypothetical protein
VFKAPPDDVDAPKDEAFDLTGTSAIYLYVTMGGIVAVVTIGCWAACTRCGGMCARGLTAVPSKRMGTAAQRRAEMPPLLEHGESSADTLRLSLTSPLASPDEGGVGRRRTKARQEIGSPPNKVVPLAIELHPGDDDTA